jgi:hypothetical protein
MLLVLEQGRLIEVKEISLEGQMQEHLPHAISAHAG